MVREVWWGRLDGVSLVDAGHAVSVTKRDRIACLLGFDLVCGAGFFFFRMVNFL